MRKRTLEAIIKKASELQNNKKKQNAGQLRESARIIFEATKHLTAAQKAEVVDNIIREAK